MVTEGDQTSGGEDTIEYADVILISCTHEIYIMLLANVTLLHLT